MPITADATLDGRTLQEFLAVTRQELAARMSSDALVAAAKDNEKRFAQWMSSSHWPHLSDQVAEHLCGFLQENVVSIFAGAWSKYAELRKCAKETRDDPGSTLDVALADHDFSYEMKPSIDVLLNGQKVATIPFSIEITCAASGLELSLREGAVYRVRGGRCNCKAQILCSGFPVWERPLAGIDLPGELRLTRPIAIVS
jgi:hypothetical protein